MKSRFSISLRVSIESDKIIVKFVNFTNSRCFFRRTKFTIKSKHIVQFFEDFEAFEVKYFLNNESVNGMLGIEPVESSVDSGVDFLVNASNADEEEDDEEPETGNLSFL